jgi:hypothetical protein
MSNVCEICDYKLNSTVRKLVCCPYCEFTACRTCCETYILGETTSKCMNPPCNREWTRQFIAKSFSDAFLNKKLKKKREEILFDIERSLLPATQPRVEFLIKEEQINKEYNVELDKALDRIDITEYKIKVLKRKSKINEVRKELEILYVKKREVFYKYNNDMRRLREEYNFNETNNSTDNEERQRREFIRACPANDCRGFLSTQWKCGLCEKWCCPDCHEIKGLRRDVEHTCNPDILASARLLSNDTKPCPNCGTGIFKIAGCDHMWCTQCRTGFNWRTGRIERDGQNPHYFEWVRRNGNDVPRNPHDIPCQNQRLDHMLFTRIHNLLVNKHKDNPMSNTCDEMMAKLFHSATHINQVIIPRYPVNNYRQNRNEDLRVRYMRNQITEEDFKKIIQRDEKKYEKNREIHNILDLLKTAITDIILRFIDHLEKCEPGKWEDKILNEVEPIVNYANECLFDISKTYKSKCLVFSNELEQK